MPEILRGAIVGFGEVARHGHWPAYSGGGDVRIVGVVDRTEERRALAESLIPGVQVFATLGQLAAALAIDFIVAPSLPSRIARWLALSA